VKQIVKDRRISESVLFLENRNDINELLQAMDVFLFPSLYEGLSIALIEAQATGVKCLISDSIDPNSIITNSVTVESLKNDAVVWSRRIDELDYNNRNTNASVEIINSGFDINHTAEKLISIYSK
jgi:glycosyltransferase involved in cell wall biosynthesis